MIFLRKIVFTIDLAANYLISLTKSNLLMARTILSVRVVTNPGFIQVPIKLKSHAGILLFSNLVSMTPGTLTADISHEMDMITVHILFKESKDEIMNDILRIQNKLLRILK